MLELTLRRVTEIGNATIGHLEVPGLDKTLCTLEDLWRDNQTGISCIPAGTYQCVHHDGPHFQNVWELLDVPGRSAVLIHWGNTDKDTRGCILVGKGWTFSDRIIDSRAAIELLRTILGQNPFTLTIVDLPRPPL